MITVLCGGVGAARFLSGLCQVVPPTEVTAIVNTGDDFTLHGLRVCPDIDTIRYTLSDDVGPQGWGRADESWATMAELAKLSEQAPAGSRASSWFSLGDRDLGTHLYRTQRLLEGATLSEVTAELTRSAGLEITMLPMTDQPSPTLVTLASGEVVDFQEYFVGRRHSVPISGISFPESQHVGVAPAVVDAISEADRLIIAPSNPFVSIAPLLALSPIASTLKRRRDRVVAVSPLVGGAALKGPADRMMKEFGYEPSAVTVAQLWSRYAAALVIDEVDRHLTGWIGDTGMTPWVTSTVMTDSKAAKALAKFVVDC